MSKFQFDFNKKYTQEECDAVNYQYKMFMEKDILGRLEKMEMASVQTEEYQNHKNKCLKNFEEIFRKLDKMERAMFGEPELENKGVLEMTREMYNSVMFAKGGQKSFWMLSKIASFIIVIIGSFWALIEFFKKVIKPLL